MTTPLEQVKELAKIGSIPFATKDEIAVFLKAILKVMKDNQDSNRRLMAECVKMIEACKAEMGTSDSESVSKSNRYAKQLIDTSMAALESKMPAMPDLSGLDKRITVLENEENLEEEDIALELPKLGTQIRDALELLSGDERIEKSAIKGLDEELKRIETTAKARPSMAGVANRSSNSTKFYDLSSQTNGVLKVFSVPKSVASILFSSDFPSVLLENNGFTINATRTQITLTTSNAPSSGSQLIYQYSSMFN